MARCSCFPLADRTLLGKIQSLSLYITAEKEKGNRKTSNCARKLCFLKWSRIAKTNLKQCTYFLYKNKLKRLLNCVLPNVASSIYNAVQSVPLMGITNQNNKSTKWFSLDEHTVLWHDLVLNSLMGQKGNTISEHTMQSLILKHFLLLSLVS